MEIIRVMGVDPSLRNTGIAIIEFNTETGEFSKPQHCQVLVNPAKYKGNDAILNMLDMIDNVSRFPCYMDVDNVIVESPPIMFNKSWSGGTLSSIAHISGGAVALLGLHKGYLFKPSEWNKSRKKEITHNKTIAKFGEVETWHFEKVVKSESLYEHVLDAASMALWWIKENFVEE